MRPGVKIVIDRTKQLNTSLAALAGTRVLVGYPSAEDQRLGKMPSKDERDSEEKGGPPPALNNATIGYLMNTGIPERNVPAREHMATGIKAAQNKMDGQMQKTGKAALSGDLPAMERGYMAIGLTAQSSIQNTIAAGIPPPLADSTLASRDRKRKSGRKGERMEMASRAAGNAPSMEFAIPLVFSGQLLKAVNFVLRKVKVR